MKVYLRMKNELNDLAQKEAEKIGNELISKCAGKSTGYLRETALNYINENHLPGEISHKLKTVIDYFILNIKIPAQKN